jgi:DNA-binding response OmpR family regulator
VEGDPGVRHAPRHLLTLPGLGVVEAGEGALAVLLEAGAEVSAVLLGADLPGMGGPATLLALRALAPGTPCLLVAAGGWPYRGRESRDPSAAE